MKESLASRWRSSGPFIHQPPRVERSRGRIEESLDYEADGRPQVQLSTASLGGIRTNWQSFTSNREIAASCRRFSVEVSIHRMSAEPGPGET